MNISREQILAAMALPGFNAWLFPAQIKEYSVDGGPWLRGQRRPDGMVERSRWLVDTDHLSNAGPALELLRDVSVVMLGGGSVVTTCQGVKILTGSIVEQCMGHALRLGRWPGGEG